jgi:hypothetical protein
MVLGFSGRQGREDILCSFVSHPKTTHKGPSCFTLRYAGDGWGRMEG